MNTYQQHPTRKLTATLLSIAVVAGVIVFADHLKAQSPSPTGQYSASAPSSGQNSTTPAPTTSASSGSFKDGTYTASSNYYVPHGDESIQVSLTLQNGVVTKASVRNSESNPDSAMFQQDFTSAYKSYVVGRKISDLQLGVIAGASDTTQGFNEAASKIASQAQA